jgi:peptidyl-dipeptidase Dcp
MSESSLTHWDGPLGGLPPFDRTTPAGIEADFIAALAAKRAEIERVATDMAAPGFANVIEAIEACGRALRRIDVLRQMQVTTAASPEMQAVNARLASLGAELDVEIAQDRRLFDRIEAVAAGPLEPEQRRLAEQLLQRFVRGGARLDEGDQAELRRLNERIAALQARFHANLLSEAEALAVEVDDRDRLGGIAETALAQAAALAGRRGRPGTWAFAANRPAVMAVLQRAHDRDLRRQVWAMWVGRGANDGLHDNRPVVNEIIASRAVLARLMGYASYAELACTPRMAGTPERARDLLERIWAHVRRVTEADLAALGDDVEPWDRLYLAERMKAERFGFDADAVRDHLSLDAVLAAAFDAAGALHGLSFHAMPDAPRLHPDIRVFEVRRGDEPIGALWLDLIARQGKGHGSWQSELRSAESFDGKVLPLSCIVSSNTPARDGEPVLLAWEYANVLFHEFGHALHMLMSRARYPSLGSTSVAWDFVEVPALLNERWLLDRSLLRRFARHHATGEPMPDATIDALEAAVRHDRVFSVTADYLATALVDLAIHGAEPGDAQAIEARVLAEMNMPRAIDPMMYVTHCFHSFTDVYAAGVYSYLWADVMAADIAEAFTASPDGLYDAETAARWRETMLEIGASIPADDAFRAFRGRDPDGDALLRRFDLAA